MTTFFSQDARQETLATIFASNARVTVLRLFMLDPMRAYYQRQIELATGLPIRAVQRELERLTSIPLLYRRTEGNRAYYQVNTEFPLLPELRSMILKTGSDIDKLRGIMAVEDNVRLAFMNEAEKRVLVVYQDGEPPALEGVGAYRLEFMSCDEFLRVMSLRPDSLAPFLERGVDILGRREDVVWRRIETAGYSVERGKGVA